MAKQERSAECLNMSRVALTPDHIATIAWGALVIAVLTAILAWVVARFRGTAGKGGVQASETLAKFREMHSQGQLSDEEFRTIKAKLTEELRRELKDSDEPG